MLPNSRLISQMQRIISNKFYSDTAYLLVDTSTGEYDAYGNPIATTTETEIVCSFTDKARDETWQTDVDIENIDGEIRFATPAPTKGNRVKVTGRFQDSSYTDQTFEIIGIRDRGEFGYVCALRKVQL